jgi:hypothetical protein
MSEPAEVQQNERNTHSWKDTFNTIMYFVCFIMILVSIYTQITKSSNFGRSSPNLCVKTILVN